MEEQIPEIPVQSEEVALPVAETPVTEKKKFNLKIILLLLGTVLLIGGGVYVFRFFNGLKACSSEAMICADGSAVERVGPNCEFAPCPPATEIPTVSSSSDETANWKTHEESIFSIKYPADLEYYDYEWVRSFQNIPFSLDLKSEYLPGEIFIRLDIISRENILAEDANLSLKGYAEKYLRKIDGEMSSSTVNGLLMIKKIYQENDDHLVLEYYFSAGEYYFIVDAYSGSETREKTRVIVDQILSTFKFTD